MTVELVITFDSQTGKVRVSGPIDQRMVCYGMLEMARDIILQRSMSAQQAPKSAILVPDIQVNMNGKGG